MIKVHQNTKPCIYIFYIVTILHMSCLFNDGRKTQRRTGKFLTTHLFLENPLQIKLKKTSCSGATEETQTWHRALKLRPSVIKRRESKTENDRIRGTSYDQNQIFLIYWSTKSIQSLSLLSARSTPADPDPTQLEPLSGLTHHHRYYPSLCNDVMVFDPGRGLGEGRNKEKGLWHLQDQRQGVRHGQRWGEMLKRGREMKNYTHVSASIRAVLSPAFSTRQWQSGPNVCLKFKFPHWSLNIISSAQPDHRFALLCPSMNYGSNSTLFLSR